MAADVITLRASSRESSHALAEMKARSVSSRGSLMTVLWSGEDFMGGMSSLGVQNRAKICHDTMKCHSRVAGMQQLSIIATPAQSGLIQTF